MYHLPRTTKFPRWSWHRHTRLCSWSSSK